MDTIRARELRERAQALMSAGTYTEALQAVEEAIALEPGSAAGHAVRGALLSRLGRAEESRAAFEQALALDPEEPRHHFNLASQLAGMGLTFEALSAAEQAARLDADLPGLDPLLRSLRAKADELSERMRTGEPPLVEAGELTQETQAGPPSDIPPIVEPPATALRTHPLGAIPESAAAEAGVASYTPSGWNWGAFWLSGLWALWHGLPLLGAAVLIVHVGAIAISGAIAVQTLRPYAEYYATHQDTMPLEEAMRITRPYQAWSTLANLLALSGLALSIWLGIAGNSMAWRNRRFSDLDEFASVQRAWAIWGWIMVAIFVFIGCTGICLLSAALVGQVAPRT